MILSLRFLLCCFTVVLMDARLTHGVAFDYYFSALRSKRACNNMTVKVNCQIKCGVDTGLCIGDECYCLSVSRLKEYDIKDLQSVLPGQLTRSEDDRLYTDFHDYNEESELEEDSRNADSIEDAPEYLDESLLYYKPALRHHIAHFCPNLDVARTCIRTCMKEGKPAFCGKDHVCYCGHRYTNTDRSPATNATNVYAQFKDLYEKYFGPNYNQEIHV